MEEIIIKICNGVIIAPKNSIPFETLIKQIVLTSAQKKIKIKDSNKINKPTLAIKRIIDDVFFFLSCL